MLKEAVFTVKLESKLRTEFVAAAAREDRSASQIIREFMRTYIEERREERRNSREYDEYLRRKVETARDAMHAGRGRTNEEVEADFVARRNKVVIFV